ncbi:hypothetical protein MFIFM68171_02794 [Madurella fahalii]|uniref:Uncharacterized protein n=1 Tax=Madurella fahalii TaxID=1157608 RepID=A0ABQ0G4J9_9PEZI
MRPFGHLFGIAITIVPFQWLGIGATSTAHSLQQMHGSAARQQPAPACSDGATIENLWLVKDLNVTYTSDELVRPGNASFTITNNLTNETERILCALRANYVCDIHGTPGDESLEIWLQINLDVARITLNQSLACGSEPNPSSAYAIGNAELYLVCPDEYIEEDLSCYGDDDSGVYADGFVMLQASAPDVATPRSSIANEPQSLDEAQARQPQVYPVGDPLRRGGRRTLPVMPVLFEEK